MPESDEEDKAQREAISQQKKMGQAQNLRMREAEAGRKVGERFNRRRRFRYRVARTGEVKEFNTLRTATERFGFHHGQRVRITQGSHAGATATIIGVHAGWLFRHQDGEKGATAFFAKGRSELVERYGLVDAGEVRSGEAVPLPPKEKALFTKAVEALPVRGVCNEKLNTDAPFLVSTAIVNDACQVLATAWEGRGDIITEILDFLVLREGAQVDPVVFMSEFMCAVEAVFSGEGTEGTCAVVRMVLLLWTMTGVDMDRICLFEKVPSCREADEEGWRKYVGAYGGLRNVSLFKRLYDVGVAIAEQEEVPPLERKADDIRPAVERWAKLLVLLMAVARPLTIGGEGLTVVRKVTRPSHETFQAYAMLKRGKWICWPSPCTARWSQSLTSSHDGMAIIFRLTGNVQGVAMKAFSQYPDEDEVLLPPFTCWCVSTVDIKDSLMTVSLSWRTLSQHRLLESLQTKAVEEAEMATLRLRRLKDELPEGEDRYKQTPVADARSTRGPGKGGLLERLLRTDKTLFKDRAITKPFMCCIPGPEVVLFDISNEAMHAFGFSHGQRCLYGAGSRKGVMTTIVGISGGKLWRHDDGGDLRPFTQNSWKAIVRNYGLELVGWDVYPESSSSKVTYGGLEYNVNERLMEQLGSYHGERVKHTKGPFAGETAVIIGCRGDTLYQQMDKDSTVQAFPSLCRTASDLTRVCGLTHVNTLNHALTPPQPFTVNLILQGKETAVDIRCSACRKHGAVHGQTVKVVKGKHTSRLGVVVGMHLNKLWVAFTTPPVGKKRGDERIAAVYQDSMEVLATPLRPMVDSAAILACHPRREESRHVVSEVAPAFLHQMSRGSCKSLTFFGELVEFDTSYATCNVFRLYHRQRVAWSEVGKEGEVMSTVVGVWLGELWRIDDGMFTAEPWSGSSAEELLFTYRIRVVGLAPVGSVHQPYDPFRTLGSPITSTFVEEDVVADGVLNFVTKDGEVIGFDTSETSIRDVAGEALRGRVLHGMQLERKQKVSRPRMVTSLGSDGAQQRLYRWFDEALVCHVVGSYRGKLWVQFRGSSHAEPVGLRDLRDFKRIEGTVVHLEPYVPASKRDAARPSGETKETYKPPPPPPYASLVRMRLEERHLRPYIPHVTTKQVNEMRYRFWRTPANHIAGVLRWVLSLHGVDPAPAETVEGLFRMLVVLEVRFAQVVEAPAFHDYCGVQLSKLVRLETEGRTSVEWAWEGSVGALTDYQKALVARNNALRNLGKTVSQISQKSPRARIIRTIDRAKRQSRFLDMPDGCPSPAFSGITMRSSISFESSRHSSICTDVEPEEPQEEPEHMVGKLFTASRSHDKSNDRSLGRSYRKGEETVQEIHPPSPLSRRTPRATVLRLKLPDEGCDVGDAPLRILRYILGGGDRIRLDVSNKACSRFGFYSGQRVVYTSGDLEGRECIIVGVSANKLWRYEAPRGLLAFKGKTRAEIEQHHEMAVVGEAKVPSHDPFEFITAEGVPLLLDISEERCQEFGVVHGSRYQVTQGVWTGRMLTVIGVAQGKVWFAFDWSGAIGYEGMDFIAAFGLRFLYHSTVLSWSPERPTAKIGDMCFDTSRQATRPFQLHSGQCIQIGDPPQPGVVLGVRFGVLHYSSLVGQRHATPLDPSAEVQVVGPPRPLSTIPLQSTLPVTEPGKATEFRFLATGMKVALFDTSDAATTPFGYSHGQRVKLLKGFPSESAIATVVGVRHGMLWKVPDGGTFATPFNGARNASDIVSLWAPQVLGRTKLAEFTG